MKSKLKELTFCLGLIVILNCTAYSQQHAAGIFEGNKDIGTTFDRGSTIFNNITDEYEINSFDSNATGSKNGFHFVWKRLKGDFILYARVVAPRSNAGCRIGWMIRSSL